MKALGYRLLDCIEEINGYLVAEEKLRIAIYERQVNEKIEQGVASLEQSIKNQSEIYSINYNNYSNRIQEIKSNFLLEINKIREEYRVKFVNFILELREANGNYEIALTNAKKIADCKKEAMNTQKYKEYIETKAKLEFYLKNATRKVDYDKYFSELQNIINPLSEYDTKRELALEKFNRLEKLVKKCEENLTKCEEETMEAIERIIKMNSELSLATVKQDFISKIINKITSMFSGKAKFEGSISRIEENIKSLEKQNESDITNIRNSTVSTIAEIQREKEEMKKLNVA